MVAHGGVRDCDGDSMEGGEMIERLATYLAHFPERSARDADELVRNLDTEIEVAERMKHMITILIAGLGAWIIASIIADLIAAVVFRKREQRIREYWSKPHTENVRKDRHA